MKKSFALTLVFMFLMSISMLFVPSCTDNNMARNYGGSETIEVTAGQKVVNVTWKENNLWILTRPMTEKDSAETITFYEESDYGINEGMITLIESR